MAFFVTFYSFKGGVGRTLALANVAWSLAHRGKRVVLIDLDLEAPSLLDFAEFKLGGRGPKNGFLEYAARYAEDGRCPPVREYVHPCRKSPGTGQLWLMPSGGGMGEGYAQTLARLSWRRLHPFKGTQPMLEGLRQALSEELRPDYVLIDSRTGFSDVGGLSTQLLADMIVLVFNVTRGCIEGSIRAYRSFVHENSRARECIQLVASPVPQVASARGSVVDRRIEQAMEHMPGLTRPIRIFYEASLVVAEELVVRNPESFVAAERYQDLRDLILRTNPDDAVSSERLSIRRGQLEKGDFLLAGRFQLLERIGQGGLAQVWRACDTSSHEIVAIKVLQAQYTRDANRHERFFRSARRMAELQHPGIVRIVEEKCEDRDSYFFVMEYVGGGNLRQAVRTGRLSVEERLRIVLEVGEALTFAHEHGLIHRDVKPNNVLLDTEDRPKLTDFDLAKVVDTVGGTRTAMLGTFLYAAPEAMTDVRSATELADVYGLGMTAVFALHGADLPPDALWELPQLVAKLEVNEECRSVLQRAVARKVEDRWPSVAEFCQALAQAFPSRTP